MIAWVSALGFGAYGLRFKTTQIVWCVGLSFGLRARKKGLLGSQRPSGFLP